MFVKKGTLKLSQKELWNLDKTLAKIIRDALWQYKRMERHGCPAVVEGIYCGDNGERTQEVAAKWESIINAMIYSFGELAEDESHDPMTTWIAETLKDKSVEWQPIDGSNAKMEIPEKIKEASLIYKSGIERGLRYFAQYFNNLWD